MPTTPTPHPSALTIPYLVVLTIGAATGFALGILIIEVYRWHTLGWPRFLLISTIITTFNAIMIPITWRVSRPDTHPPRRGASESAQLARTRSPEINQTHTAHPSTPQELT